MVPPDAPDVALFASLTGVISLPLVTVSCLWTQKVTGFVEADVVLRWFDADGNQDANTPEGTLTRFTGEGPNNLYEFDINFPAGESGSVEVVIPVNSAIGEETSTNGPAIERFITLEYTAEAPDVAMFPSITGLTDERLVTVTCLWNGPVTEFDEGSVELRWYDEDGEQNDETPVGTLSRFTGEGPNNLYEFDVNFPGGVAGSVDVVIPISVALSADGVTRGPLQPRVLTLAYTDVMLPTAPDVVISFPERIQNQTFRGTIARVHFDWNQEVADFILAEDVTLDLQGASISGLTKINAGTFEAFLSLPINVNGSVTVTVKMNAVAGVNLRGPEADRSATLIFDNRTLDRGATNVAGLPDPVLVHTETNDFEDGIFNGALEMHIHANEVYLVPQLMHARGSTPIDLPDIERMARAEVVNYNLDSGDYLVDQTYQYVTTAARSLTSHGDDLYWFEGTHYAYQHNQNIELDVEDGRNVQSFRWKGNIGKLIRLRFGTEMRDVVIPGRTTTMDSVVEFGVGERNPSGLASIGNTLYMVGFANDALYTLDTATGRATRVGSATQFGVNENLPLGIASIDNTLYMVGLSNNALYTLDTTTGIATRVGSATAFGVNETGPNGLASIDNTLYMVGDSTDALYTLDVSTGIATRVGSATTFGVGEGSPRDLASIGSTLYMVGQSNDALYTLNTTTGRATRIGRPTRFGVNENRSAGLASIGNTLYMVGRDTRRLLVLNTTDGTATFTLTTTGPDRTERQTFILDGVLEEAGEWRSAFINPDSEVTNRDEHYGVHGGTASPLVSGPSDTGETSVLNVFSGYGNLENIGDINDAVSDVDNWQWLQLGERLNPKFPVIETDGRTGWSILEDMSRVLSASIGFDVGVFFLRDASPGATADYDLELNAQTLEQPINSVNFRNDEEYLYNTIKVRYGDQTAIATDEDSIAANRERELEVRTLLDFNQEPWAQWLADKLLARFKDIHQVVNLTLKLSGYIKVGDIINLMIPHRAHLNELVQVLEVNHNVNERITDITCITFDD